MNGQHEEEEPPVRAVFNLYEDDDYDDIRLPIANIMLALFLEEEKRSKCVPETEIVLSSTDAKEDIRPKHENGSSLLSSKVLGFDTLQGCLLPKEVVGSYNHKNNAQAPQWPPKYSIQQRPHIYNTEDKANDYSQLENCQSEGLKGAEINAIEVLQGSIKYLRKNPDHFVIMATGFITMFQGLENNFHVIAMAIEIIFEESIKNPSFRFMGVRLYNYLYTLNAKEKSLFYTLVEAKLNFNREELQSKMDSNQDQIVRETALFLAELYMQQFGYESYKLLIAEHIIAVLKLLITKATTDNVNCICLILFTTGFDLKNVCPAEMEDIINILNDLNQKDPVKYPLAAIILPLLKNNCGASKASSSDSCSFEGSILNGFDDCEPNEMM